ncbi:MAG: protein kinase domain-containing protein [Pseudomonadota bacterium]
MTRKIGRFEIRRELGRGAQSIVYLAYDPHLQREVAIKTLHFAQPDPLQNRQLLQEARTVSQLRHPNIVPIFEAGEQDGDPYLVFEFVAGANLAECLKREGAMAPARAAAVMSQVLDAIGHAHQHGVIHRDLKPSNILLTEQGVPRVMDFGIAVRETPQGEDTGGLAGTPAYLSPEYITEGRISVRSDLFSAGLVLYEMLLGQRAVQGGDIPQVMRRIAQEPIILPGGEQAIDEKLGAIVLKAVARDPRSRFESAAQMKQALDGYLETAPGPAGEAGKQSTLDFLLRRMKVKSDFPALSESISTINKITGSEKESVTRLSNTVLKDFALTNKILRLVNSAFYRQAGGGKISTISRAVIVLGFNAIRNIAVTLLLFEHLQDKANAAQLKEEFLRATLAGCVGRDVGARLGLREAEEAFVCAMFHNLGRLLCQYYFPEEAEEIRKVMQVKGSGEDLASAQVLGLSFEDLGLGVARIWGFPETILASLQRLPPGGVRKPVNAEGRLRVISALSNELCAVVADVAPEERGQALRKVAQRFGAGVPLDEKQLQALVERSVTELKELAAVVHLDLRKSAMGRRLRAWSQVPGERVAATVASTTLDSIPGTVLKEAPPTAAAAEEGGEGAAVPPPEDAKAVLAAGIQDISNALLEDFTLNDILRIVLETMYRAMGFTRVLLCIKDARSDSMNGRFGFGPDINEVAPKIRFSLAYVPDVFHIALHKGVDILISDTDDPKIVERIPDWYRKSVTARSFVVFPLKVKDHPVAMIYADKERAGDIVISEEELRLLRTLRNQAVLAMKQSMAG